MDREHAAIPAGDEDVSAFFSPGGPLARALPGFDHRPQQVAMARSVARALRHGRTALIEAGTGTGKSLAYLVPAALVATVQGRVVVSTNTINLQEQLVTKDIPLLQSALPPGRLQAALVKGWGNYVCLLRLERAAAEPGDLLEPGETATVAALRAWAGTAREGSRSELEIPVPSAVWEKVNAESDNCLRTRCPHYDACFVFRARRQAQEANVLVVNHHLLFADVAVRREVGWDAEVSVLPRYAHVIFDEAHHVEEVATDHFGIRLSRLALSRLTQRLIRRRQEAGGTGGLVGLVRQRAATAEDGLTLIEALDWGLVPAVGRVELAADAFFGELAEAARGATARQEEAAWRYPPGGLPAHKVLREALEQLAERLTQLPDQLLGLSGVEDGEALAAEVQSLTQRARRAAADLDFLAKAADPRYVYWAEGQPERPASWLLAAAPIEVGEELRTALLENVDGTVFTSATLSVAGGFAFLKGRLGLAGPLITGAFPAPFDYAEQALLAVPADLPEPDQAGYAEAFARALGQWLLATGGRSLVLFTAYGMLERVYQEVAPLLGGAGIPVLRQGSRSRSRLLDAFRQDVASVLLATDSFWEGVDVPGEALSCVVLARLPFRVPSDPVSSARCEALLRQGRQPFAEYTLPQAVLKFKQGFGRLIRSAQDRGVVIVADRRILTRPYGRVFLNSLPPCRSFAGSTAAVAREVGAWLGAGERSGLSQG